MANPFQDKQPSILAIKKQRSHMEPDADEVGGKSDKDSDNVKMAKIQKMLATKRRRK